MEQWRRRERGEMSGIGRAVLCFFNRTIRDSRARKITQGFCTREMTSTIKSFIQTKIFVLVFVVSLHEWARLGCSWAQAFWHQIASWLIGLDLYSMSHGHGGCWGEEEAEMVWWICSCDRLVLGRLCHMVSTLPLESGHILAKPDSEREAYRVMG